MKFTVRDCILFRSAKLLTRLLLSYICLRGFALCHHEAQSCGISICHRRRVFEHETILQCSRSSGSRCVFFQLSHLPGTVDLVLVVGFMGLLKCVHMLAKTLWISHFRSRTSDAVDCSYLTSLWPLARIVAPPLGHTDPHQPGEAGRARRASFQHGSIV